MIKYYTSAIYRKHYTDLEKLHLIDNTLDNIQPYDIGKYILKQKGQLNTKQRSKSTGKANGQAQKQGNQYFESLLNDLEVYKNIELNPVKIFKCLLLVHCNFLLIKNQATQNQINQINGFFKWILQQINSFIDQNTKKQQKRLSRSKSKKKQNSIQKPQQSAFDIFRRKSSIPRPSSACSQIYDNSKNSLRSQSISLKNQEQILNKEIFLLANILKPYLLYLQKVLSTYSYYQKLLHGMNTESNFQESNCWSILNMLKLITSVSNNFSHIGRYFYKEYSPIVYLFIEFFSKQIIRIYPKLVSIVLGMLKKIEHQYYQLLNQYSEYEIYHDQNIEIQNALTMATLLDEISKTNDALYHIYLGKYFYKVIQKLKFQEPKWLQMNSKQCEFLFHYIKTKYKKQKDGRRMTPNKPTNPQPSANILQQLKGLSSPTFGQFSLPKPQVLFQKKNLLPRSKNTLKLSVNEKSTLSQSFSKQDTLTFRMKDPTKSKMVVIGGQFHNHFDSFCKKQINGDQFDNYSQNVETIRVNNHMIRVNMIKKNEKY